MAEAPNSPTPGSNEARDRLKEQMGIPETPPAIISPESRVEELIDSYSTKTNEFAVGGEYEGFNAHDVVNQYKRVMQKTGKTDSVKGNAIVAAFEQLAIDEDKPSFIEQIASGTYTFVTEVGKGLSEGARKAQQSTVDAIINPMLDLAGISYVDGELYVASPKAQTVPDNVKDKGHPTLNKAAVSGYLAKQAIEGKAQPAYTPLPKSDRLISIPGGAPPETAIGKLAEGISQVGLSYVLGDKIAKPAQALQKAIPAFQNFFATPGVQAVLNTSVGEALTLQAEDRFATMLRDDFGVKNEVIDFIAGSKDEGEFTQRLKSGLDGVLGAVGLGVLIEPFLLLGKSAYNMGFFAGKEKNPEKAKLYSDQALDYVNKMVNAYPQRIVKEGEEGFVQDPLVSVKKPKSGFEAVEEAVEQLEAQIPEGEKSTKQVKRGEILVPKGEIDDTQRPIQAEDFTKEDFDVYMPGRDVELDSNIADVNLERLNTVDSVKTLIQEMAIKIQQVNEPSKFYGKSSKGGKNKDNILTFDEVRIKANEARQQLEEMGIAPQRFVDGLKATTEQLPYLVLAARDLVVGSATKLRKAGEELEVARQDGRATKEMTARFGRNVVRFGNILAEVRGVQRDIARTEAAMRIEAMDGEKRAEMVETLINEFSGGHLIGKEDGEERLFKLAGHFAGLKYVSEVVNANKKDSLTRVFDAINFLGVNNYLANLSTQTVNLVGSFIMTNLLTTEKFLAAGFNATENLGRRVLGKEQVQGTDFNEATAHTFGVQQAMFEIFFSDKAMFDRSAFGEAKKGFVELDAGFSGYDISNKIKADGDSIWGVNVPEAISGSSFEQMWKSSQKMFGVKDDNVQGINNMFKDVINGTGVVLGYPGRLLMAGDRFFRAIHYRSAIHALAMQRATREGLQGYAVQKRYMEILQNLPEDIDQSAQTFAQVALFQENLDKTGIDRLFRKIERARNAPLPDHERKLLASLGQNAFSSFVNSKIPFFRTPYNIFKQTLVERNPLRLLPLIGNDAYAREYRAKFLNDAAFRQDVLAKSTTGGMMMYLGYSLGGGLYGESLKELLSPDGKSIQLIPGSDKDARDRDVMQDQLRQAPELLVRSMSTGEASTIPLGRIDPLVTWLQVGGIIGTYEQYKRTQIDPYQEQGFDKRYNEKLDELNNQLYFHMGNLFMDKAMLRGVKDIVMNIPGMSPYGDWTKLPSDYLTNYAFAVPGGNMLRGITGATTNQRILPESKIKEKIVPKREGQRNISRSDIEYPNLSKDQVVSLNFLQNLGNKFVDEWRKVYFIDGTDPEEIRLGPGAVSQLDWEGNPIGFNDREASLTERWLEQNLIPFSFKKVNETNTSVLISALKINAKHPKRWTHITVGSQKIPLTTAQQATWAFEFGQRNKDIFSRPRYAKVVKDLKKGATLDKNTMLAFNNDVASILNANEEAAQLSMLRKYPALLEMLMETDVDETLDLMK